MSMRSLLSAVRTTLINDTDITDLVSSDKITFARRPQRDSMPGITFNIGSVRYDESIPLATEAITYRVNINIYGRTADETTQLHDLVKTNIQGVSSATYHVRLEDERYGVDVDNNHVALVGSTWQISQSGEANTVNHISPAFQGADRMKFKSNLSMANGGTTTLDLDTHGYALDFPTHSGAASHTIIIPAAVDYMGKMYTFVFGNNVDNNSVVTFDPVAGRMEGSNTYTVNRGTSSMTVVAVENPSGVQQWRIIAYKGLHD